MNKIQTDKILTRSLNVDYSVNRIGIENEFPIERQFTCTFLTAIKILFILGFDFFSTYISLTM